MRLCVFLLVAMLQGCAVLLPEGSQMGFWFRIGYDQNRSMSLQWDNIPKDPDWKCPKVTPEFQPGVPIWMKCE